MLVSDEVTDDTGGHLFRQFLIRPGRAVAKRPLPRRVFKRRTPSLLGIGLLERVSRDELGAAADPDDSDADGISGRLPANGGRFGWKSRFAALEEAVAAALVNELGLTNPRFPGTPGASGPRHLEITAAQLDQLTEFVRQLPGPPGGASRRDGEGEAVFNASGCAACHTPRLRATGWPDRVAAYTDFLLHDMGPELADGFPEGETGAAEFRTPPLWGIGSIGPPFLHDGRADTLDLAIRLHGGEGRDSRRRYEGLHHRRRAALIRFLESL